MAGYSGTPLPKKLGLKEGHTLLLAGAPDGFDATLGELPDGVTRAGSKGPVDVAILFAHTRAALERGFLKIAARLDPAGGLWVAWPKKASGVATDMTEDVARAVGLEAGLVDNKVCAIDDVWSGLRFVVRVADRPSAKKKR